MRVGVLVVLLFYSTSKDRLKRAANKSCQSNSRTDKVDPSGTGLNENERMILWNGVITNVTTVINCYYQLISTEIEPGIATHETYTNAYG